MTPSALSVRTISAAVVICCGHFCCVTDARADQVQQAHAKPGFLFVNDRYVAPPYNIEWNANSLSINEHRFTTRDLDLSAFESGNPPPSGRGQRGRWAARKGSPLGDIPGDARGGGARLRRIGLSDRSRGGPRRGQRDLFEQFAEEIKSIQYGGIVVLRNGEKPLSIVPDHRRYDLLKSLMYGTDGAIYTVSNFLSNSEHESWRRLVENFEPTEAFRQRADSVMGLYDAAEADAEQAVSSNLWINRISYPLTVFAMGVVVLGFGHLLSNRPRIEEGEGGNEDWSKHRKIVGQSLLIVGLLSCVDLIWTLGTGHAGLMKELNPLGKELISAPLLLSLFKAAVTGMSIAILYRLHRRPIAQMASWWCCLMLTLLTARWIVFQSMFI